NWAASASALQTGPVALLVSIPAGQANGRVIAGLFVAPTLSERGHRCLSRRLSVETTGVLLCSPRRKTGGRHDGPAIQDHRCASSGHDCHPAGGVFWPYPDRPRMILGPGITVADFMA